VRLHGADADGAAHRVLAEERALGAAQHLDLLDVEHREHLPDIAGEDDPVHVDADARVEDDVLGALAHAADADRSLDAAEARAPGHVRHEILDLIELPDLGLLEQLLTQRRNRDRRVLEVLLALAGDDLDDLELSARGLGGLGGLFGILFRLAVSARAGALGLGLLRARGAGLCERCRRHTRTDQRRGR
jgi:hypothetical protein